MERLGKALELANEFKLNDLLNKKEEENKKTNTIVWVLAIIGFVVAAAAIGYAVYRYFHPDYLEDFDDEFEDDFDDDDDFFEDEGVN
ncbi:MAG: DUF4366 domain-containing protein [Lachnospiraceae bacterium]|nr:DUF4366 domain-containing protein [Lachnospiraceae bacterium]